jgi:histone H3/H4
MAQRKSRKNVSDERPSGTAGVSRLIRKAGIVRHNKDLPGETNLFMITFLENLMRNVVTYAEYEKVKTYKESHVTRSYNILTGRKLLDFNFEESCGKYDKSPKKSKPKSKPKRKKHGDAEVRFYDKEESCLFLQKLPFKRAVRYVEGGYVRKPLRLPKSVSLLIQGTVEMETIRMLSSALLAATNSRRITVNPNDIRLVGSVLFSVTGSTLYNSYSSEEFNAKYKSLSGKKKRKPTKPKPKKPRNIRKIRDEEEEQSEEELSEEELLEGELLEGELSEGELSDSDLEEEQ